MSSLIEQPDWVLGSFELKGYPFKLVVVKNITEKVAPECNRCELDPTKNTFSAIRAAACNEFSCLKTNSLVIKVDDLGPYAADVVAAKLR